MTDYLQLALSLISTSTGVIGAAVGLATITSNARTRRKIEFYETKIKFSRNKKEKFALESLHRESLSKIIARDWVPLGSPIKIIFGAYITIFTLFGFSWISYNAMKPTGIAGYIAEAGTIEAFSPLVMAFLMPEFMAQFLVVTAMRRRVRRQFLREEDIVTFKALEGNLSTLAGLGRIGPISLSLTAVSLAICGITYAASSVIFFRLSSASLPASSLYIPAIAAMASFLFVLLGLSGLKDFLDAHAPKISIADTYPPCGNDEYSNLIDLKVQREITGAGVRKKGSGPKGRDRSVSH